MVNKKELTEETKTALVGAAPTALVTMVEEKPLFKDEQIVGYFAEAIECIKEDRKEANERYLQMADFIINGSGDASSSTKEAMTALLKIKSDGVSQMTKLLDLMIRLKMKERVTPSQIHAFQQNNKYEVAGTPSPQIRNLIKLAQQIDSEPTK